MDVTIVRPELSNAEMGGMFGGFIAKPFLSAWVLMLFLGIAHLHVGSQIPALGYWQTLVVYVIARHLFGNDPTQEYKLWTKRGAK